MLDSGLERISNGPACGGAVFKDSPSRLARSRDRRALESRFTGELAGHSAVGKHIGARDAGRFVAQKKETKISNFLGLDDSFHGYVIFPILPAFLFRIDDAQRVPPDLRVEQTR